MPQNTKEVYKFIKYAGGYLIFFCCIAFLLEKGLAFFVLKSSVAQTGKINLLMSHSVDPQIIIYGSSVAEVGFNSNVIAQNLNQTAASSHPSDF